MKRSFQTKPWELRFFFEKRNTETIVDIAMLLCIACGTTDFLYQANLGYMKYLDSIDFPYTYRESDGGHIWRNWRLYLSEFAPMLWK